MSRPRERAAPPAAAGSPMFSSGAGPAGDGTGEVTRLLKQAAYFPIFNVHNPAIPNDTVPLLPFATNTLGQALVTAVNVNEELRRFDVVTQAGPQGLTARNRIGSNGVANVSIRWTPIPEGYAPSPGVSPPPTLLNPFASQRFTMLNGQLSFQDRRVSGVQAFGSGRTFPVPGRAGSLNIGAVIDILQGSGALYGLSDETLPGATMVINGFITPPNDLALNLMVRVMDPSGQLAARGPIPPLASPEKIPAGSGVYMFFLGETDPRRPMRLLYGPGGAPIGAQVIENLRLVGIDFDVETAASLQSRTVEGPIVGTASAILYCNFQDQLTVVPAQTTGSIFSFHDSQGRSLGTVCANMIEGRAFRTYLPGAPYPVFRMGGFGPLLRGTGAFAGINGMMSVNGVVSAFPPTLSNLYVLRLEDPVGRFQDQFQGAANTV
jgi:hypothetical protein